MTAKEYLNQAYRLEQRIEMHRREIEELKLIATSVASPGFDEHYNPTRNTDAPYARVILKVMEMERKETEMLDRLLSFKLEITDSINMLEDKDERIVLYRRYLCNDTWVKIGEHLGWDEKTIRRIHTKACSHFRIPENPMVID